MPLPKKYILPTGYLTGLAQGKPIRQLDAEYGINRTVSPLLRVLNGITVSAHVPPCERWELIEPLLAQGYSQRKVSRLLHCSVGTVNRTIHLMRKPA